MLRKSLARVVPAAILDWFRTRSRTAFRFRVGSLVVLLALGWPLILPGLLSLIPGYVEFEFNSLPALIWVWFPVAVTLVVGLLLLVVPWLRERRLPFPFGGIVLALIVAGGLRLAYEHGLDLTVRAALMGGFAQSRVLEVHGERMIVGNYKPGFKAKLFKKDFGIAMQTLAENGVSAPASAVVQQLVHAQVAAGRGEEDYSAIGDVIFELARLER